jgi:ribosomal protein L4
MDDKEYHLALNSALYQLREAKEIIDDAKHSLEGIEAQTKNILKEIMSYEYLVNRLNVVNAHG